MDYSSWFPRTKQQTAPEPSWCGVDQPKETGAVLTSREFGSWFVRRKSRISRPSLTITRPGSFAWKALKQVSESFRVCPSPRRFPSRHRGIIHLRSQRIFDTSSFCSPQVFSFESTAIIVGRLISFCRDSTTGQSGARSLSLASLTRLVRFSDSDR